MLGCDETRYHNYLCYTVGVPGGCLPSGTIFRGECGAYRIQACRSRKPEYNRCVRSIALQFKLYLTEVTVFQIVPPDVEVEAAAVAKRDIDLWLLDAVELQQQYPFTGRFGTVAVGLFASGSRFAGFGNTVLDERGISQHAPGRFDTGVSPAAQALFDEVPVGIGMGVLVITGEAVVVVPVGSDALVVELEAHLVQSLGVGEVVGEFDRTQFGCGSRGVEQFGTFAVEPRLVYVVVEEVEHPFVRQQVVGIIGGQLFTVDLQEESQGHLLAEFGGVVGPFPFGGQCRLSAEFGLQGRNLVFGVEVEEDAVAGHRVELLSQGAFLVVLGGGLAGVPMSPEEIPEAFGVVHGEDVDYRLRHKCPNLRIVGSGIGNKD